MVQMQKDGTVRWYPKSKKILQRNYSFSLHLAGQRKQLDRRVGQAHLVICEVWISFIRPSTAAVNSHNHVNELC